ncbi:hypothetical protein PRIPAC_94688 [Pristionchus pacificus]|uniref:Uncharacterized protein n=1 Tax=Pristionchus pacificus TaxID=54126 RepID=A0A2A6BNX6_PRIPA|nr:hypothetical protein PRIPAC_94688 [Pristionchus pacificus]|eukprot:PDM67625.1 hypothetical protein PRIPAC_45669 [Pristionchus pacificus]
MSFFFIAFLIISMGNMILGSDFAPVTIVDRCFTDMMMMGARMGSGQGIIAELDTEGFDLRNATDGRVLAILALASSAQLNFRGNLNIGSGVRIGGRAGTQNFYNAFIEFNQGVFGSLGNDGSNIRFTCNRTTCIYNHLFPKTGNGLVVTFCE